MKQLEDGSLSIRLFGQFEAFHDDAPISSREWHRRKTQTLLKLLLTLPGRVFTQDQLIDALFPDLDLEKAVKNLYARMSELRHVLEPELRKGGKSSFIQRVGQGYRFAVEGECWIDTQEFERCEQEVRAAVEAGRWMNASEACRNAINLYWGDFLAEDRYEDWAIAPREEWSSRHLAVLEHLAHCQSQLGLYNEAAGYCKQVVAIQPCREATCRNLMRYLYQAGEYRAALREYQACVHALNEQLDVDPAPETVALREKIVRHELPQEKAFDPLRVAVLPLANFSPDPNDEYFADGMTEEMIVQLSKIDGFQIVARTSIMQYKNTHKGIAQIGRELRVGTVLEGSVRKSDSRLRIAVQLISVNGEAHLWSNEYDRDLKDAFAIQRDVAKRVATSLAGRLLTEDVVRAIGKEKCRDPAAYELYLKGRFFWNKWTKDGYAKAIEYYKQALAIDPDYALAYAGLADVYNIMAGAGILPADKAYPTAKGHVIRALEIDDTLAEAHASLGFIAWLHERDLGRAEQEFRKAVALNPNYPAAYVWYAQLLEVVGRVPESLEQSRKALALDPVSANLTFQVGMALSASQRLDEAIDMFHKTLDLNPAFTSARLQLSVMLRRNGEWERGIAEARRTVELEPENPFTHQFLSIGLLALGRRDAGLAELEEALRLCRGCETTPMLFKAGVGCCFAREYDRAIGFLEQVRERDPAITQVHIMLAATYIQKEAYDDALSALEKAESVLGGSDKFWSVWIPARRGQIYARQGDIGKAEEELDLLLEKPGLRNRACAIAVLLVALGRVDEAFEWAEKAVDANEPHVGAIKCIPCWDEHRSDPRYHALLRKMGLEE